VTAASVAADNLFADTAPEPKVEVKTVAALSSAATYMRGTVLAQSENSGFLYIAGSAAPTPPGGSADALVCDCILCDDEKFEAGTVKNVSVYVAGRFNARALFWAQGYSPSMGDMNSLRERNILLAVDFD
jgi:hypothetical protein